MFSRENIFLRDSDSMELSTTASGDVVIQFADLDRLINVQVPQEKFRRLIREGANFVEADSPSLGNLAESGIGMAESERGA